MSPSSADGPDHLEQRAGVGRRGTAAAPRHPHAGERATEEDPCGPGVGAVVHARRVAVGVVHQPHQRGAGDRPEHQRTEQPAGLAADLLDGEAEDDRPHDVELLLDRERPEVLERRRPAEGVEVRLLGEDQEPVGRVGERCDDVAAEAGQLVRDDHRGVDRHRGQHREQRGQEAAGPPHPEVRPVDGFGALPLLDEQGRDEEAADDEEDLDAQEAAGDPRHVGVVEQHRQHRDGPEAVEGWLVAEPAPAARGLVGATGRGGRRERGHHELRVPQGTAWAWGDGFIPRGSRR